MKNIEINLTCNSCGGRMAEVLIDDLHVPERLANIVGRRDHSKCQLHVRCETCSPAWAALCIRLPSEGTA